MIRLYASSLMFAFALQLEAQTSNDFIAGLQRNFGKWDLNHDGILSSNELDTAVADPQTIGANAAIAAALKRASRQSKVSVPPLTIANITLVTVERNPDLTQMFREGCKRIASITNRTLFSEKVPKLELIHQGKLGNCFCLAPLGAMVHGHPDQVAAMFAPETNGNYWVQLGKKAVEVSPPTDAEIAMTSSNEHGDIWVNLYEKAVGTARNDERAPEHRLGSPLDALAHGGSAGTMLAYLTGHQITRFSFKFAKAPASATNNPAERLRELRQKLAAAVAEKRLMTSGTVKPSTPGLTPNHAYAVLDYNEVSDTVQLWNPHGQNFHPKGLPGPETGYPTRNGIFEIPVEQFVHQFSGIAFEVMPEKLPPANML